MYICLQRVKVCPKDDFDDLLKEVVDKVDDNLICRCGDFNAHTKGIEDYPLITENGILIKGLTLIWMILVIFF